MTNNSANPSKRREPRLPPGSCTNQNCSGKRKELADRGMRVFPRFRLLVGMGNLENGFLVERLPEHL